MGNPACMSRGVILACSVIYRAVRNQVSSGEICCSFDR